MVLSHHQLWALIVVIFAVYIVFTLLIIPRQIVPTDVKSAFPSEPYAPLPLDDVMFENLPVDFASVKETESAGAESNGPNDIKILMHNPDVCKNLPGTSNLNLVGVCVWLCVCMCVRVLRWYRKMLAS